MSKYLCIAGHGKKKNGSYDPGAGGFVGGEHSYMKNKLFPAMKKYANNDFIFIDNINVYDYKNLVSLAKTYGKDTKVIEFHYDASSSQSAKGGHVIVHQAYSPDSMDLRLRDVIDKHFGVKYNYNHKGYKGVSGRGNLANVNRAKSGGVNYRLLELGFGTNRKDANVMLNQTDDLARRLVEAIKGSTVNKPPTTTNPTKPSQPSKLSNDIIATKVLRGDYGNGQERVTKLTNEGYNPKVIQGLVDQLTGKFKPTVAPKPATKPKFNIAVDGFWGKGTNEALQKTLGTYVDGVISGQYNNYTTRSLYSVSFSNRNGSNMVRALQKLIGVTADGYLGPNTIKALQKYLGTPIDGKLSKPSMMVKEMQRRLNNGTFIK